MSNSIILVDTDTRDILRGLEDIKAFIKEARVPLQGAALNKYDGGPERDYWQLINVSDSSISRAKRRAIQLINVIELALDSEKITEKVRYGYGELQQEIKWNLIDELRRIWGASSPGVAYATCGTANTIVKKLIFMLEDMHGISLGSLTRNGDHCNE